MTYKACNWLDKNQISGLNIRNEGNIYQCCIRWVKLVSDEEKISDYNSVSYEYMYNIRKKLLDEINSGQHQECHNCPLLTEVNEQFEIGPIKNLIYHPHTLCNLNCVYCFYTDEQRSIPIDPAVKDVYKTIKHFYETGLLNKQEFMLDLGGGEPLLLDNIDKTLEYMSNTWEKSQFHLLTNATLTNQLNSFISAVKENKFDNVYKQLKTSVDAGERETYKKIRKGDYFYEVSNNLINCAESNVFDEIMLKYILLDDKSNIDDDNIFGFLHLCKIVSEKQNKLFSISIDIDWQERKNNDEPIGDYLIEAAGKMYYFITHVMKLQVNFISDYLSGSTKNGNEAVHKIIKIGNDYRYAKKSARDEYEIKILQKNNTNDKLDFLNHQINELTSTLNSYVNKSSIWQYVFSVSQENNHTLVYFLGIKMKFKKGKYTLNNMLKFNPRKSAGGG